MRHSRRPGLRAALVASAALLVTSHANALMVSYQWVPEPNSGGIAAGSGTLTFNSASITDPDNFSSIPASALVSFSYTWQNGATFTSPATSVSVSAPGWSAQSGSLTTTFQLFSFGGPGGVASLALNGQPINFALPNVGNSSNNMSGWAGKPDEVDTGNWQRVVVPLPSAVWLLLSGLTGLFAVGRGRRRLGAMTAA